MFGNSWSSRESIYGRPQPQSYHPVFQHAAPVDSDTINKQIRRINGKHNNAISLLALPRGAPHHESDQSRRSISVISADQRVANPRPHELLSEPLLPPESIRLLPPESIRLLPPERLLSPRTPAGPVVRSSTLKQSDTRRCRPRHASML